MYKYQEEKAKIFTEDGQVTFLEIRDKSKHLLKTAGCFRMQEVLQGITGDSWLMLACIDRLVELNEIREITDSTKVRCQNRIFTFFPF